MKQFSQILRCVFFPPRWVVLLSALIAAVLLIYTFAGGHQEDWTAIPAYCFSTYALALVCVRLGGVLAHAKGNIRTAIDNVPLARRYFSDVSFRLHISLYFSLALNVIYAVIKFAFGLWYRSVWFGTLAAYYALLAVMRFLLLRHV